ncbi:hypothetical protein PMIN06_005001 [Paraphaeosphaeria minitans]|uniref:Uncharacterized protein n=1 Tax=Paraphaeosphaeria minitans TaxID=565426 RepID=A0A9P6GA62_9PLEO|nr:hypothetical protein PMIN01_10267 [Paraphaeosphaeria minitans]
MSYSNRSNKAAALLTEQGDCGSPSSPQRCSSKASNQELSQPNGNRDSNSVLASSGAVLDAFALSDMQTFANSTSAASFPVQGATRLSAAGAHGGIIFPFPEELVSDSVNKNIASTPRKREKLVVNDSYKGSKHSVAEHNELVQGSKRVDDIEIDAGPNDRVEKKNKDETGNETEEEKQVKKVEARVNENLPYRSIKTINIPKRSNQDKDTDAERRPQENDLTTWYGSMLYRESLITYFCDEVGLSYQKTANEATVLQCFPDGKVSSEWIRNRHLLSLDEQYNQYGLKNEADIPRPTAAEARRGLARLTKASSSIAAKNSTRVGQNKDAQGSAQLRTKNAEPRFVREAPARQLEMTQIVVWKDLYKCSFDQIRSFCKDDFDWVISSGQVAHFYHLVRPSAYGIKRYRNIQDSADREEVTNGQGTEVTLGISRGNASGEQQVHEKQVVKDPQTYNNVSDSQAVIGTGVANEVGPGNNTNCGTNAMPMSEAETVNFRLQMRVQPVVEGDFGNALTADVNNADCETTVDMDFQYDTEDSAVTHDPPA